jgi:hypothetical protein
MKRELHDVDRDAHRGYCRQVQIGRIVGKCQLEI